jgi:CRISPR-associated endoribonuclease Cas6
MRLEVELNADSELRLDLNYNHHINSLIYRLLFQHDKEFSSMLHNRGYVAGNKRFKLFVFSRFMPESYSIDGKYMLIKPGKCRLFINSPIEKFIECLGNSLLKNGTVRIDRDEYRVNNIYLKDNSSFEYETEFRTLSPIVVTTARETDEGLKARTVYINEPKFTENIKNNLLKKYWLVHGKLPDNMGIDIEFDQNTIRSRSKGTLTTIKGITLKGFIAPFNMRCSKDIKKIAIDCGIGENNSMGMGYIIEREKK